MRAHPRSRGENDSSCRRGAGSVGSSPLTRGKRVAGRPQLGADRLIPAHAGKTSGCREDCHDLGAHPRSRGENGSLPAQGMTLEGSSPLTRGKPWAQIKAAVSVGLIPAHAGKTAGLRRLRGRRTAHPRSRGENRRLIQTHPGETGSSPLTRGKHRRLGSGQILEGLIPAHAGKTLATLPKMEPISAHPRSRGENGRTRQCQ